MSDCSHKRIKCMECHRYVGIQEQTIPPNLAIARILQLEEEIINLEAHIELMSIRHPSPPLYKRKQHEAS